ncbi:hypothetical protein H0H93_012880 [Arthromyces matolae]|nr:hypothetical protein H0H93_012880 [Arthromyces matolae]
MKLLSSLLLIAGSAQVFAAKNDDTLWGPYRPNLYFGLRPRIPHSLMTGLMWFGTHDYQSISLTRHACEQSDNLDAYTWTEYDPRQGGVQVIHDSANNVKLTTEFLKIPGGENGGSWAARVKGEPIKPDVPSRISTIFYFGLEGIGGLEMETDEDDTGILGEFKLSGSTPELDDFVIRIVDGPNNAAWRGGAHAEAFSERIGKTHFIGQPIPSGGTWQAKDSILNALVTRAREVLTSYQDPETGVPDPAYVLQLPDEAYSGSNLFAVQKLFDGAFQFDVFFESGSSKQKLNSHTLDQGIPALVENYKQRFRSVFPYPSDYAKEKEQELDAFSRAITSNLVAGVGYFYGNSIVNRKFSFEWDEEEDVAPTTSDAGEDEEEVRAGARLTDPKALLTATPSRSFFPRGFYWDEGFHLLHIGQWDNDFSLEILKSWIDLVDEEGWVAREQILGEEARSKVPQEFQAQVPNYANPPTLTMAVTAFINRLKTIGASNGPSNEDLGLGGETQISMMSTDRSTTRNQYLESSDNALAFLRSIYKPLKRHYDWFRRTQRGQIKQYTRKARSRTEGYRWRGRSEAHVLTSGMDDYPRGPPHAGELHLDLISWMAFFTRTMKDIAAYIGETDDEITFLEIETAILGNIEGYIYIFHFLFSDLADLRLRLALERRGKDFFILNADESYHVCHKGYLTLFPLFLSLLPPSSPQLGHLLDLLRDPEHLWSPYGIRSLSAAHPEFGQGENYWKGAIWVQMNYLILRSLHTTYAVLPGPHQAKAQEIYRELRKNVIDNVFKVSLSILVKWLALILSQEYERTGYVWEQYDALTGEGKRRQAFSCDFRNHILIRLSVIRSQVGHR